MYTRGFTILELIIVVGIIAILSAIGLVAISESRTDARNTAVINQMLEYRKALELYHLEFGRYPGPTNPTARATERCIGGTTNCWPGANSLDTYFATEIQAYMARPAHFDQGDNFGSPAYNGCTGTFFNNNASCTDQDFSLFYLLEGSSEDCGEGVYVSAADYQSGRFAMCRMMPPD